MCYHTKNKKQEGAKKNLPTPTRRFSHLVDVDVTSYIIEYRCRGCKRRSEVGHQVTLAMDARRELGLGRQVRLNFPNDLSPQKGRPRGNADRILPGAYRLVHATRVHTISCFELLGTYRYVQPQAAALTGTTCKQKIK